MLSAIFCINIPRFIIQKVSFLAFPSFHGPFGRFYVTSAPSVSNLATLRFYAIKGGRRERSQKLRKSMTEKQGIVDKQGNEICTGKASNASKDVADSAGFSKEAFRQAINDALERRMFCVPSFKIYHGVEGPYDDSPPGDAIKANLLSFGTGLVITGPAC